MIALPDVAYEGNGTHGAKPEASSYLDTPFKRLLLYAVMFFAIVSAAFIDIPRARRVGPMTWLGALTVAECGFGVIAILYAQHIPKRVAKLALPIILFIAWGALSCLWYAPRNEGLQNLFVYIAFAVLVIASAVASAIDKTEVERGIGTAMLLADIVGLGLVVASLVLRGWPTNIDVRPWLMHPRGLALFGLVPLSWHLARWSCGKERSVIGVCLWMAAIFVSLSRTATASGIVLVVLFALERAKSTRLTLKSRVLLLALAPVVIAAALSFTPFRNRMFVKAAGGESAQEFQLRDNGRTIMWGIIARSALEKPVFGHGLGTSEGRVSDKYYWVGHPHQDYLRVWHDLGAVGLILLLTAFGMWWQTLWKEWRRRSQYANSPPIMQLAGLGALAALMLGMLTDNSLVYNFVMAPTAVLIGAGIGAPSLVGKRRVRKRRRVEGDDDMSALAGDATTLDANSQPAPTTSGRVRKRKRRSG